GARIPSIFVARARQGARRVEPRDHGLEYEEDVCPHPRLTRPCAAWRRESRWLPVNRGDHNAIWTPPNVRGSWPRQNRPRRSATKPQSDGLLGIFDTVPEAIMIAFSRGG